MKAEVGMVVSIEFRTVNSLLQRICKNNGRVIVAAEGIGMPGDISIGYAVPKPNLAEWMAKKTSVRHSP